MTHYHGGPAWPIEVALKLWRHRHAFVSFERPDQVAEAAGVAQSFALDNGAFSAWRKGQDYDFAGYADFVAEWRQHPGFDWAVIPDSISGSEVENDRMIAAWMSDGGRIWDSVPVWHLHESLDRLDRLVSEWPRVALGSSGEFKNPKRGRWWGRMHEAMQVACDSSGRPRTKLHGLRMLDHDITAHLPLSSADSTNVARNVGLDKKRRSPFRQMSKQSWALAKAEDIEGHAPAEYYSGTVAVQVTFRLDNLEDHANG